jgi:membrane-associated phospholipid phosphatase
MSDYEKSMALLLRANTFAPVSRSRERHVVSEIRWDRVWLPIVLVIVGWIALSIDLPVAKWFLDHNCPDPLARWFSLSEVMAHGLGVVAIVAAVAFLDPVRRAVIPRLLTASIGAGLLADFCKLFVARARPHSFSFDGTVADTFQQWLPLVSGGSGLQGFPSAHMATAVGLAIGLAWLYPRGHWFFVFLAVSAGGERVVSGNHFVSDVAWGAAVGAFCAIGVLEGGLLAPWFDRFERKCAKVS